MLRILTTQVQVFEAAAHIDEATLIDQVRRCTVRTRQHGAPDAVAWVGLAKALDEVFDRAPCARAIRKAPVVARACGGSPCW